MVAILVRLKLTLLGNSLRRSVWRTVGLVVGLVYGLGAVVAVLAGLVALRFTSPALTADVTVVAFSLLTLGWLLMSLLVFGVDETVDPARFALLPVRARELLPGLLAAALIGVPGVATVLMAAGLVVTWARTGPLTVAAVVAFPLGVVTCVLLARVATSAFAAVLASRRFRDLVLVGFALFGRGRGPGRQPARHLRLPRIRAGCGTPGRGGPGGRLVAVRLGLGDPRRYRPRPVADRRDPPAAGRRAGGRALAGLGSLPRRPADLARSRRRPRAARSRESSWVDRLFPATPAGGVAAPDAPLLAAGPSLPGRMAGFLVAPVILIVTQLANPDGRRRWPCSRPPDRPAGGVSIAQDLSYDGSALWLHVSSGLRGADDRAGRVRAAMRCSCR